jgi:WD40 repeat protein
VRGRATADDALVSDQFDRRPCCGTQAKEEVMPRLNVKADLRASLQGHTGLARCVAFSPDGKTLASVSHDGTIRLWSLKSLREQKCIKAGGKIDAVAYSPDGKLLATCDTSARTRLWSLRSGEAVWSKRPNYPGLDGSAFVTFSPDGNTVASSLGVGIRLLKVDTGKSVVPFPKITNTVASAAFSPDAKTLVSGSVEDGEIKVWDTETGQERRTLRGHTFQHKGQEYRQKVWCVAFSPDGNTVASGSADETIKLWDASTGSELHTLKGHDYYLLSVAFSPAGRLLASSSADLTVKLWDTGNARLLHSFQIVVTGEDGHGAYSVAFSPAGHELAAACSDGLILLWDLQLSEK